MDFLKELFDAGALTWEQFVEAVNGKGYKLADLSQGMYVGKKKHEDEIAAKDASINDLKGQIKQRDGDITSLKTQLEAGTANEEMVAQLNSKISEMETNYANAKQDYEKRISKQSYEFAVREYANAQQFTSNAAKRDFINEMISENLKMKNNTIIGADDFKSTYAESNADAFVVADPEPTPQPEPTTPQPNNEYKPTFVQPTAPQPQGNDNPFANAFNFAGVRPHQQ